MEVNFGQKNHASSCPAFPTFHTMQQQQEAFFHAEQDYR